MPVASTKADLQLWEGNLQVRILFGVEAYKAQRLTTCSKNQHRGQESMLSFFQQVLSPRAWWSVVRYSSRTVSGTNAHHVECPSLQLPRVTRRRTEQQLDSVLRNQHDKTPIGQHAVDYLRFKKLIHQKPSLDSMLLLTCCKLKTKFQQRTRWSACCCC